MNESELVELRDAVVALVDQMNRNLERIHDEVSKPKVNVVSL